MPVLAAMNEPPEPLRRCTNETAVRQCRGLLPAPECDSYSHSPKSEVVDKPDCTVLNEEFQLHI